MMPDQQSNDLSEERVQSQRLLQQVAKNNHLADFVNSSCQPVPVNWIVGGTGFLLSMYNHGSSYTSLFESMRIQDCGAPFHEKNRCFFLSLGSAVGLNPYLLQAAFRYEAQILHKALLLEPNRSLVADKLRCLNTVLDRGVFVDSAVLRLIWPADFQDIKIYLIADLGNGLEQLECFTSNAPVAVYKEVFLHLCGGHFTMLKPSSTEEGTKLIKAMEGLEKVDPESRFILHHEAALGQRTIQSIVDSMLATTAAGEGEGGSDAEDAQLEDFAATIPRATEAEVAAAWENLHQQTNTEDMAVQTSAFRAFLTSYLVRRADPSTPFDQLSLQQLWEMFFKVRKELALEERQPRSADEMFQALRGLNMETAAADNNGVTQHLIEETISEVQKNVIRVRAMHPEDFFAPSSEQVPFTDTQLDALLQKVTAAPSVLQIQYILHQLPTSSGTFSADQVLTYYFTSFDPDACAAFVPPTTPPLPATPVPDLARAQGVGILRSFAYSPTARPTSAEAAAARAQKLHPTVKTAIKKISEKFDRRLLKRLLARIDQPFPLCPKSPLLLRQVRKYFWENHKVLKFDLTAEVKAADLRAYPSLAERLYVIDCGFQALYGYRLHLVQLTALAALIIQPQVTRRLLQVLTGEGKSNIITALAIYLVKCKDPDCPYVDIITTHHHLAKRDAGGELKRMFDLFGVTVAHIAVTKDTLRPRMARPEYLANVVFGTSDSFVFDVLGTEYYMEGQRNNRPFAYCIIDEVDSMFMDKNTDVCRLSSYAVGLSDTVLVLMKIWYFITRISVTSEGQYQLFSDVQHSTKEQILALVAKKVEFCLTSQASADSFVEELSSATADADADANAAGDVHTPPQRVVSEAGKMASNPATLLNVNEYARDFMLRDNKKHLRTYVDAAFEAFFNYSPDLQYVIYHGNIVIQDLKTGQSQFDSQWRDGLQQFLQMKHDLGVKNETLETNLMSSKKLFFRYKKGLYGLTGTFGNHANQAFLRKLHDPVTFVCIPGNYAPARLEYPAIRTTSEQAQLADISLACHRETSEGRPVLVICEDIDFAKKVIIMLNSLRVGKLVKAFIFDNGHQEHKICMDCGEIIVATCLLGRGADIELTPHAKHSGGLHVILPFTPDSVRVLLQAFGRCGRKELLGTAQVIDIVTRQQSGDDCAPLVCNSMPHATYMELVYHPEAEEVYFNSLAQSIALIDVQEEVFWEHYLELITGSYQDAELVKRKNVPEIFDADGQMDVDHPVFRAVEERWAIFYRQYKDEPSQLRSRFAAEVGIYADSLQHGSRRAERESCVVSSGLRIRLANLQCRVDADYAAAAERCDSVVNNDPRNYFAAVQRVYYMLRANSWDSSPRYPAEVVVQAIQVAEELLEAATNRVQAAYVAQRVVFEDNLRRSGEGQTELSSSFKVDDILSRRAPSLLAKIPPKHHSVGSIQASTKLVTPAVNTNQLNPRPVQPKVHRDTHISTGPTAAPVAETATGAGAVAGAEDNSEAAASNGERTQDHHQQQTRIEKIPGLETIVELRRRMMKLKETVHGASDIRYVDAELDSLNAQDRATDAEAYCEGLTGYPKPVLRNKPQPKRRGSWWPILIGVICGCVGGWLVAGATLGSGAFLGGSMLIGSGISDILLGVQSLSSGQPVKFGQWIQGKTKVIASAVALWISKMSPELAASRAAAVTREAAVHVTLPDGINVRDGNLHGVPEAMARATAAAPPMETRQIYRVLDPPVTAKHSARDTPRAGKQQVPATSGTSGPTPAAAVAPSTSTSTSSAFTFSAPAASTLSSPAPSVDNHFNRPDVFADLERCLGDIAAHLESSMPEEIELRAALRPYRVEIEALLMQRPVLLRLASVYAFAGNHLSSYLGEVFAKILDGNHHTEDSQDKCRMCWYGAVPQVVSNGSGLLPILYKRADSNLADVLCSEELQDAIIHDIRYEGVCGVYGDTYGDLLYSALLADIEYTTKPKPSISIDEFKANIEALVNAGKLENDWLTIKSAPATAAAPIAQGKASARPMPTGAILRKSASATPHLQPRRPLSPEAFFRSVTEGSSRFLADYVYPESAAFLVEVATTLLTKAIQDKHCKVLRDEYNKARGGEIEPISEDSIEALLAPFQTLLRAALLDAHVYGSEELSTVNTDETDDSSADKTRLQQLVRLVAIAIHHSPGYKETVRSMFKRFFLSVTKDHNGDKTVKYRLPWSVAVPVLSTSRRYLPIAPELATELVSVFMRELCQQELMTLLELKNLGRSAAYVVYQNEAVSRYPSALAGSLLDEQLLYVDQAAFEKCAFQLGGRLLLDRITLIDTAVLSNATLPPTLSFSSSVFGPTAVAAGPPSPPSPLATSNAAADATADDVSKLPAGTHPEVERFLREVTLHTSPFMAVAEGVALTLLTELTITALVKCIQQKQEEKLTRYYS